MSASTIVSGARAGAVAWCRDGRALAVAFAVGNAAWVAIERRGQMLDIDEAGYFSISMVDHAGWTSGGFSGWWDAIQVQPIHAPLAPALASVFHVVTGPRILNIFLVNVIAYAVVVLVTHLCTRRWSTPARLTAMATVSCTPALLHFSRSFNFSPLTSAMVALAVYFAVRSERCAHLGASCAWGAAVGGMLLARTMTFAFLPGIVLGMALPLVGHLGLRAIRNLAAGVATAFLVAATWYWANADTVFDYLRGFGYGARAAEFGDGRSLTSPTDWYLFAVLNSNGYLQAGVTVVLLTGGMVTATALVRHVTDAHSARGALGRVVRLATSGSATATACWVAIPGVTAMMSSRTNGSAFIAPLVMPMALIAARGVDTLRRPERRRVVAMAAVVLVLPAALVSQLPMERSVTASVHVDLPMLPAVDLSVIDSRGTLRTYVDGGGVEPGVGPRPGTPEHGEAWFTANARLNDALVAAPNGGGQHLVLFTFRHRLANPNSLMMDAHVRGVVMPAIAMLSPGLAGETAEEVLTQTDPYLAAVSAVFTATEGPNEFEPTLPAGSGELVVARLGFVAADRFTLPDGRVVTVWVAPSSSP